jgi:FkbM family methyltransferase
MRFSQSVARATVHASDRLSSVSLARYTPIRQLVSVLSNRVAPELARRSFRPGIQEVNGVRLLIPRGENVGSGGEFHMALGTYEEKELTYILHQLVPGGGFVDVGAHIGYFSLAAAAKVGPTGCVFAIEPTASSLETLRRNVAENGFETRVQVIDAAASSSSGVAVFHVSDTSSMFNTLEPDTLQVVDSTVEVRTVTLDEVLAEAGWPSIQVVKMDVEGHERSVLMGGAEALSRYPDVRVVFEASGTSEDRYKVSLETIRHLEAAGFGFAFIERGGTSRPAEVDDLEQRMRMPRWQDSLFNVAAQRR